MNRLQPSGIVAALAWMVLSFLALPAFAVIPVSFTDTRYLAMPQEAAVAAALAGFPVEQRVARQHLAEPVDRHRLDPHGRDRGHALRRRLLAHRLGPVGKVRGVMILPMAVPTIVYALGLYRLYVDLDLVGTRARRRAGP